MADGDIPVGGKPYSDDDKIHLFLAYFGLLALVPFLMFKDKRSDPQKEYVYWHGREGLALALVGTAGVIVILILYGILSFITAGFGALIGCVLWPVVFIALLVPSIIGWMKAFKGEKWEIPLIHGVALMFK